MLIFMLLLILIGCGQSDDLSGKRTPEMLLSPMCSFTRGDKVIADTWPAHRDSHGNLICREEDAPK